ncbi:MAG: murein biosynthesis integral membrane protein MurJ [Bacilli bacterium]|nr:murein biosynthesis integral membrane protein MurJ [Bacilli bacterium]MDD4809311.1 murein biosynthesis integral membrane protein MurJ [Bacilli bacterium]
MTIVHKTTKSALIIIVLTLGSKLLGFIRETLIAAKFGSGSETDAFFIALTVTSLITTLIMTAITTTFVPLLSEIETKEGKKSKIYHVNNMLNIIIIASIVMMFLAWFLSPLIIKFMARGFDGEQFNLAVTLTRIGLPIILLSSLIGSLTGFLHSEQRYKSSAAIGFPLNFIYIFFLLFLATSYGIVGLMITAVIATLSQIFIQIPEARKAGFRFKFVFDIKDKYIKKVFLLSVPVLIGVAVNDINIIINKTLASNLVSGSISALNYADKLKGLILGVFVSAIITVIFPLLSDEFNSDNIKDMKKIMRRGVNLIFLITIPATIGLVVLATPIIQVAFERGAFTPNDTIMTASALVFYSLGLLAAALRLLLIRVYFSLQNTRTPMLNGILFVGLNIILNLILVRYMAHRGLAFATSISNTIATLLMFYGLKREIGSLGIKEYITVFIKIGLASIIMGLVMYIVYNVLYSILEVSILSNFISLLVAMGLGFIIYGILCYLFKVEEVRYIVKKIRERFLTLFKNN